MNAHPMSFARARSVAVVGSGTAGLFAALALKRARPELRVAIVASKAIPVIGVGEATTPPIVAFLHGYLGLDPAELFARVAPTWKLGIRFEWGAKNRVFHYAFGGGDLAAAQTFDGSILDYSLVSRLMDRGRGLVVREGEGLRSLLGEHRFAYHLDNAPFVAFLEEKAAQRGIETIEATVTGVRRDDVGGIEALLCGDRELSFDAYVDASGFRSQLLGDALGVPFESYDSSLYCDSAIVGNGPLPERGPLPFTRATTMSAGWCWTIPMRSENHYGYVFASKFLDAADAETELRARFDISSKTRIVNFRSGRRRDAIAGNVAAIGNAYGFVEPLESTALHMAITTSLRIAALATGASRDVAEVSRELGEQWDYLRAFLAVHYRFNRRLATPFWEHCRASVELAPLQAAIDDYRALTLFTNRRVAPSFVRDTVFGARGLDLLLLGQDVFPAALEPEVDQATWDSRKAEWSAVERAALSHGEALEACDANAALLGVASEGWVHQLAESMRKIAPISASRRVMRG